MPTFFYAFKSDTCVHLLQDEEEDKAEEDDRMQRVCPLFSLKVRHVCIFAAG